MSKWCGNENCLLCVDNEPDPYVRLPREDYDALRAENARLREALEEMAGNLMGSPKRKLMLSDDDFWQTPGEHTLRQWLARVALQPERGGSHEQR